LTNPYKLAIVPVGVQRLRAGSAPGIAVESRQLQAVLSFGTGHVPESLDIVGSTLTARPAGESALAGSSSGGAVAGGAPSGRPPRANGRSAIAFPRSALTAR